MKTFSKYDPEQGRTYPITVDGETRWAKADDAIELAYRVEPINTVMYADSGHNFRGFALHLFHGEFWTVSNDGTYEQKHITRGWVRFDEMVRQYDADPRWTPLAAEATQLRTVEYLDSQIAFNEAIKAGRLSANPDASNFAGRYMYMGTWSGKDAFKNIDTREYIA